MGLPWVLPIVQEVELLMANEIQPSSDEVLCFGSNSYRNAVTELVLGKEHPHITNGQVSRPGTVIINVILFNQGDGLFQAREKVKQKAGI